MRHFAISFVASTVLMLVACGTPSAPQSEAAPPADPPAAEKASASSDELVVPGARFDRPAGWLFREPSSSMRLAEAEIPGGSGAALLTVFFFGAAFFAGVFLLTVFFTVAFLAAVFFFTGAVVDGAALAAVFLVAVFLVVLAMYYISLLHAKPGYPDVRHPARIEPD